MDIHCMDICPNIFICEDNEGHNASDIDEDYCGFAGF